MKPHGSRLPREVDLRDRFARMGLTPRSQGGRGTCSLFAVVGVLEYEYAQAHPRRPTERLSVEYLNWASHQTNGRRVDGSFFSDALKGVEKFGLCKEAAWPYAPAFDPDRPPPPEAIVDARSRHAVSAHWIKEWDVKTGLTDAQIDGIRQSLAEKHPVAVGLRWPKQVAYQRGSILNQPPPEGVFDGHSVVLVGYTDDPAQPGGGTFLFRNSSGPDWEMGGYARMTYAYARAYANDAVTMMVSD